MPRNPNPLDKNSAIYRLRESTEQIDKSRYNYLTVNPETEILSTPRHSQLLYKSCTNRWANAEIPLQPLTFRKSMNFSNFNSLQTKSPVDRYSDFENYDHHLSKYEDWKKGLTQTMDSNFHESREEIK